MTEPDRIEAALERLGAEHEPPVGWEARVLAATATRKPRPWWWAAVPAAALAVITLVIVVPPREVQQLELTFTVEKAGAIVRGDSAHVGDIVHATATGGGHSRAIWVYHNDHLVVACPGAAQCRSAGNATFADVELSFMGRYKIIALTSSSPVPTPTGAFDTDVANAQRSGTTVLLRVLPVN